MVRNGDDAAATGRARRVDATRNAGLLLAAAKELFGSRGPDVPLDEVARHAGVGNATLYRHFPTRGDLLVAVYADEVAELCRRGEDALGEPSAGRALFDWLAGFVVHVATKRALALAAFEGRDAQRTELFDRWHESMTSTAARLLDRAKATGAVRPELAVGDVLALVSGAAIVSTDSEHARQLLRIVCRGFAADPGGTYAGSSR